ncbi:MAG: hypothetical protein WCL19_09370 [Verrucomicrobiota bacterium]
MKFTLVFPTHEATDLSLAAVFVPCLVWMEGAKPLENPHPENPHYLRGDLQKILARRELKGRLSDTSRKVTVVCHPTGHGTEAYLKDILSDLGDMGFEPIVVRH